MEENKKIVATQILVEWSNNPKMQVLLNDMPKQLRQDFDDWLSEIENEENSRQKLNLLVARVQVPSKLNDKC